MAQDAPHYTGHRQRLKAKLADNSRGLADYEILELVLALTLPRRDTKPLAKELIHRFGSLKEAVMARPDQVETVKGVGESTKAQWMLLQELFARLGEAPARRGASVNNPEAVARAAMARLGCKGTEEFWVVFMDTKNRVISWEQVSKGTTNATALFPREVVAAALRLEATNLILVHNHPGGSVQPSGEDTLLTAMVAEACKTLGIAVRDHIIVTDHDYYSFNEAGRLQMQQLHAIVHGQVQGVWFRGWTREIAGEIGVTGWVRNLPDGTVETLAQGDANQLDRFQIRLKDGPPLARVTRIDAERTEIGTPLPSFQVRR
eukprot:TRINITY_DN12321_c0_g1_i1.p2 TRINITY_DN12321_c0_g1~~TRINITY_DN12321_c0_g1_i1.p2  ORF type:complete len:318 (-),score=103.43 TRINITY_DN12321_c0_g1_i1:382-1335(-)